MDYLLIKIKLNLNLKIYDLMQQNIKKLDFYFA